MTESLFFLGFEKEKVLLSNIVSYIERSECDDNIFVVCSHSFMSEYVNICKNNIIDYQSVILYAKHSDFIVVYDTDILFFLENMSLPDLRIIIINSSVDVEKILSINDCFISIVSIYLPLFSVTSNEEFILKNIMLKYNIYYKNGDLDLGSDYECEFLKCFSDYYIIYDKKSADFLYLAFEIITLFMIFLLHQISSFFAEISCLNQRYLEKLVAKDILDAFNICINSVDDFEIKSGFIEIVKLNLSSFIQELQSVSLDVSVIEEVIVVISNILNSIFDTDEPMLYLGYIIDSNKKMAMLLDELQKAFIQDSGIISYVYNMTENTKNKFCS